MRILVCVKQVPDGDRIMVRNLGEGKVALDISDEFRMNRFDEFAVEEAVRIKESVGDATIHVITVGPERAADVLKRSMGMGADGAIHLRIQMKEDTEPASIAGWLAAYARPREYDLILCGSMSEDGMNGQVGPMTAALLDIPYATQVIAIEASSKAPELMVEREIEAGAREIRVLPVPCLLALQPGINRPRYPSLSRLLRAHRHPVETILAETLGHGEGPVSCVHLLAPQRRRAGLVVGGSAREKAERVAAILKEKGIL